jgi:hypothetical protein
MIIAGIAGVVEAMIWLMKPGTRWRAMIFISDVPSSQAANPCQCAQHIFFYRIRILRDKSFALAPKRGRDCSWQL